MTSPLGRRLREPGASAPCPRPSRARLCSVSAQQRRRRRTLTPAPRPYPRGLLRGCSEGQRRGAPAASDPGSESRLASCPRRTASSSVCVARCSAPRARPGPLPVRTAETNASAGERRPPLAPRTPRVAAADVCAAPPPVPGGCARPKHVPHTEDSFWNFSIYLELQNISRSTPGIFAVTTFLSDFLVTRLVKTKMVRKSSQSPWLSDLYSGLL